MLRLSSRFFLFVLSLVVLPTLWVSTASAQDPIMPRVEDTAFTPSLGARIGGYGFRQSDGEGQTNWEYCRMNGVGLFGAVDLNDWFFTELALDGYYATGDVVDSGLDRLSVHALASVGARFFAQSWVSPHLQIGGGGEWTRVQMGGAETEGWYPSGFIGTGGELNLVDNLKFGLNLRVFAMTHPESDYAEGGTTEQALYDVPGSVQARDDEGLNAGVPMRFEMASQLQFYVRFTL